MAWININELINQFGEKDLPKTKDGGSIVIDEDKINAAINQAELYFKQNLEAINVDTSKFEEPQISEIRMYLLDYTRWVYSNKDLRMTEQIEERFKNAVSWLSDVKKGKLKLINIEQDEDIETGFKIIELSRSS